jgi:hypothetical protein
MLGAVCVRDPHGTAHDYESVDLSEIWDRIVPVGVAQVELDATSPGLHRDQARSSEGTVLDYGPGHDAAD